MFFVMMLFFFVIVINNIFFWWRVFVFIDLVFIFLCKKIGNYINVLNYFIIQETLGLIFLLLRFLLIQFIVVMRKMGLTPFHYWIFTIISGLDGWIFLWFLTFQKVPFIGVLIIIFFYDVLWLVLFGFLLCYWQLLLLKNYKYMLTISSTETFNWILLGFVFSFFNGFILFLYYIGVSLFIIPYFNKNLKLDYEWFVLLFYINLPLGVSFFVKIFVLGGFIVTLNFVVLLVLLLMFMNFLCLRVWIIMKRTFDSVNFVKSRFYYNLLLPFLFLLLL